MNVKILASLATIAVASTAMGYGTYAFFSDTETSTGNLFAAGDLDLTLDGTSGLTGTIGGGDLAPGDAVSGSILLRNEGSIFTGDAAGHAVDLDLAASVLSTDVAGDSPVPMERYLVLTALTYDGTSLLALVGDADGDGRAATLADLAALGAVQDLADPGASGKTLALTVEFAEDAPNHLQQDAAELELTFFLAQAGEVDLA